jgi:hypothetical protein
MAQRRITGILAGAMLLGGLISSGVPTVNAQSDWCMSSPGYMNGCREDYFNESHAPSPGTLIVPDQLPQTRIASTQDLSQAGPQEDEQPGGQE